MKYLIKTTEGKIVIVTKTNEFYHNADICVVEKDIVKKVLLEFVFDYEDDINEVLLLLCDRYVNMIGSKEKDVSNMIQTLRQHLSNKEINMDKANRWIGFIQSQIITMGYTDIETERNFTRPLFHKVYEKFDMRKNRIDVDKC